MTAQNGEKGSFKRGLAIRIPRNSCDEGDRMDMITGVMMLRNLAVQAIPEAKSTQDKVELLLLVGSDRYVQDSMMQTGSFLENRKKPMTTTRRIGKGKGSLM